MPADGEKSEEAPTIPAPAAALSGGGDDSDLLKQLGSINVGEKIKGFVHEYQKVGEEGTPLRQTFAKARTTLNDFAVETKKQVISAKEATISKIEEIKPDFSWLPKEFGSAEEFGTKHRGLAIGGIGLLVAIPSALGGKRRMLWNGLLAAGATAGALSFAEFWERRMRKRENEGGRSKK